MSESPEDFPEVEPGMIVETTEGDLGNEDVSKPKVAEVVRNDEGAVEKLVVQKGAVFKKKLEVPADRIETVEKTPDDAEPDKVLIATSHNETESLAPLGTEALPSRKEMNDLAGADLLSQAEESIPTAEGLRRMEGRNILSDNQNDKATPEEGSTGIFSVVGPGFLSGMAGNDSSAVTSYSVNGATNGYSQLWLMLLSTPLYQAVQYACGKIGRVTEKGLSSNLRENYGLKVAIPATLLLVVANLALIAADLVAIGAALELMTGLSWFWFMLPVTLMIWYVTVFQDFNRIKKIFVTFSLAFVAYLVTGIFSGADWGAVLSNTFIPHLSFDFNGISAAVALLGATISPYTLFWQTQGEKEEKRPGPPRKQFRFMALDIASGAISGNLVAYFIIVCTSATIFAHHDTIHTAADAAMALEPLLGPVAKYLFAIGLIGAGVVAIPVLLASTSYAVSGTFGWAASLWKKPWQNEGFYLILTLALVASLVVALLGFDPIQLMFWANVLQGILSPVVMVFIWILANNKRLMKNQPISPLTNIGLILAAVIMFAATCLLFYSLLTGQGS